MINYLKKPKICLIKKIALICILTSFIGCNKKYIQVFNLTGLNTEIKDKRFVYENDTVKITYVFWAERGVMAFDVFNKMKKPIFIDWKNSSFIYNGNKTNYWRDEINSKSVSSYVGSTNILFLDNDISSTSSGVVYSNSNIVKPERITFIPPQSNFQFSSFLLFSNAYNLGEHDKSSIVSRNDNPKKTTVVYYKDFTNENSPLKFRNFLSISFSENSQDYFYVDNFFYLSSVNEMDIRHFRGKIIDWDMEENPIYEKPLKNKMSFYLWIDKFEEY